MKYVLIDTHAHLNAEQFDEDRDEVIARARENGVQAIINIGYNRETIPTCLALAEKHDFIYAVVGWHPTDAKDMTDDDLEWLAELSRHPKVVGLGEMGLDYHWDTSPRDVQAEVFRKQIRLARKLGMPIVIHNRDAHQDVIDILREEQAAEVGGVMHCFSGSWEIARMALEMNFYISFGGPLTFKNAKKPKEVAAQVPLERLLIETDCPYLAPHPYRGKRNESAYVRLVLEEMAQLRGLSVEEMARITTENARRLFNLPDAP